MITDLRSCDVRETCLKALLFYKNSLQELEEQRILELGKRGGKQRRRDEDENQYEQEIRKVNDILQEGLQALNPQSKNDTSGRLNRTGNGSDNDEPYINPFTGEMVLPEGMMGAPGPSGTWNAQISDLESEIKMLHTLDETKSITPIPLSLQVNPTHTSAMSWWKQESEAPTQAVDSAPHASSSEPADDGIETRLVSERSEKSLVNRQFLWSPPRLVRRLFQSPTALTPSPADDTKGQETTIINVGASSEGPAGATVSSPPPCHRHVISPLDKLKRELMKLPLSPKQDTDIQARNDFPKYDVDLELAKKLQEEEELLQRDFLIAQQLAVEDPTQSQFGPEYDSLELLPLSNHDPVHLLGWKTGLNIQDPHLAVIDARLQEEQFRAFRDLELAKKLQAELDEQMAKEFQTAEDASLKKREPLGLKDMEAINKQEEYARKLQEKYAVEENVEAEGLKKTQVEETKHRGKLEEERKKKEREKAKKALEVEVKLRQQRIKEQQEADLRRRAEQTRERLQAIREEKKRKEEQERQVRIMAPCAVCMEEVDKNELITPCKHAYCKPCLRAAIESALKSKTPFICCKHTIQATALISAVPPALRESYRLLILEKATPNATYCHWKPCGSFIPPTRIKGDEAICSICGRRTCYHCKQTMHPGRICQQDKDTQKVLDLAKRQGWRQCPGCRHLVEKSEGCLHMTCTRCKAEFCYNCGRNYSDCERNPCTRV